MTTLKGQRAFEDNFQCQHHIYIYIFSLKVGLHNYLKFLCNLLLSAKFTTNTLTAEQYDGLAGKVESLQLSIYGEKQYSLSVVMAAMSIYPLINIFFPFSEFFWNISTQHIQFWRTVYKTYLYIFQNSGMFYQWFSLTTLQSLKKFTVGKCVKIMEKMCCWCEKKSTRHDILHV